MGWEESERKETGTVSALERLYGVMNYELEPYTTYVVGFGSSAPSRACNTQNITSLLALMLMSADDFYYFSNGFVLFEYVTVFRAVVSLYLIAFPALLQLTVAKTN